ncbi:m7GpppX diphosphatase [Sitodiplosis mosellana]|uniref:m7GpppX diphosphatase n=1 Tax=Sitodiplosis mosellana TaxID=263140 RepID=UPI002444ECA4|nr:m7GpppX diphosphatase [Sitodiplosis mosellana]
MAEKTYDLSTFRLERILNKNSKTKTICVLGTFPSQQSSDTTTTTTTEPAIVVLEKTAFTDHDVNTTHNNHGNDDYDNDDDGSATQRNSYFSLETQLQNEFINDIYGNFLCFPLPAINSVKLNIICPCTEKHIQKYTSQDIRIVLETPHLYNTVTEPRLQLEREQFTLDWVYNILEHKKEVDRIIFEDPCKKLGFILLPDFKWDGKNPETFYAIAIVHQLNLRSLRSLTAEHLPLLRNIQTKGIAAIAEKYGLDETQLRIYVHYQPSFYHLHVHFTFLKYEAPGTHCERSHLLSTVINNIELVTDYYQRATIPFTIKESDPYYQKYRPDADTHAEPIAKKPKIGAD